VKAFHRWLIGRQLTSSQIELLASHLTVGETYFFRDPDSFGVLEREILPTLAAERRDTHQGLRLWSAGCCTGEEAYSLAITCLRAIPDAPAWNIAVLGTDINPRFLAKAEVGTYGEWSFRGAPTWLKSDFFVPAGQKTLSVRPEVKRLVSFGHLNLALDPYPTLSSRTNAMDVIFCRNVLMYFTPIHQQKVVAALHKCLVEGGYLFVNPAEAGAPFQPWFTPEHRGNCFLFRKSPAAPAATFIPPADAPAFLSPPFEPDTPVPEQIFSPYPTPEPPQPPLELQAPPSSPPQDRFEAILQLLREGRAEEGMTKLATIAEQEPQQARAPITLARFLANQGRLEEALAWCRKTTQAAPTEIAGHYLTGTILQELSKDTEAVTAFGRVLYLDQNFILAHHALGGLYQRLGRGKESAKHFRLALDLAEARPAGELLPEGEGMTCGRLAEALHAMMEIRT